MEEAEDLGKPLTYHILFATFITFTTHAHVGSSTSDVSFIFIGNKWLTYTIVSIVMKHLSDSIPTDFIICSVIHVQP